MGKGKDDIEWKITNTLKNGTILKPEEKLPITPASLKIFTKAGIIAYISYLWLQRVANKAATPID